MPPSRPFPAKLQHPEYPAHFEVRKVATNGGVRWACERVRVSHLLGREYVGLEQVADDSWAVYFGPVSLGWLPTRRSAILDHDGSPTYKPKRPRGPSCSTQRWEVMIKNPQPTLQTVAHHGYR